VVEPALNGIIAQFVALTCHANAFLAGLELPAFYPGNSTCQFCRGVQFVTRSRRLLGKTVEKEIAATPDTWFEALKTQGVQYLRLCWQSGSQPGVADRMLAGLVGGGGIWYLEAVLPGARSQVWLSRWEVVDPQAPDRRIWQVTYQCSQVRAALPQPDETLEEVTQRMQQALRLSHEFSDKVGTTSFRACFFRAIEALGSGVLSGYHRDLAPPGLVSSQVSALLDAAQSAWVFGGMGSWNDLAFQGEDQREYERLSEQLYQVLIEAICTAANSTIKFSGL
jgi:hypothetical protein